jgi:MFS family permease
MCAGFLCLIAFALINSVAEELWLFYLAGVLLGVGLAWTSTTMISAVVNIWTKEENRGKITGAVLSANGLGGALAVQILSPIIFEEGNPFGYRNSYRLVALILAIVLVIVLIFFKDRPKGAEKTQITKKQKKARGRGWVGMEYGDVLKKPYFYLAIVCLAFTGMALQGLGGIATPHMYDVGISKEMVANISSVGSLIMMGTKFLTGFMYDKKGIKITMNICLFSSFVSLISLVFVSNTTFGITLAFVMLIFRSIALPLETVMLPLYASELFGNKSFVSVLGVFSAANYFGYAVGAPLGNLLFDAVGNYNVAFIVFACLMAFVTISMQFVVKCARKDRKLILDSLETIEQ